MKHTLIAVFDKRADAQSAHDELLASGFSASAVRLSGASAASGAADDDTGIGSGIRNFFSDLFGADHSEHTHRYEDAITRGRHVVTLSADSLPEAERAADIVERFGPTDIDEHADGAMPTGAMLSSGSAMGAGAMSAQSGAMRSASVQQGPAGGASLQRDTGMQAGASQSIPVVEEQLKVGKREVQRGGVRIFSRIVETPVDETVDLREEHVDVQRRRVDTPLSPGDSSAFREQTIEMRETAEEAVVEKTARVVEEVTIGQQVSERRQQISDTVRHTEVDVQRLDGADARSGRHDDDSDYRNHFASTYGASGDVYEDYAPAYGYGSQMASSGRYSGRQWDEIEPELRSDWDSRHGDGASSTWDRMKAAVRHGWDRITSGNSGLTY